MSSVVVLVLAVTLTFGAIAAAFGPFLRRGTAAARTPPRSVPETERTHEVPAAPGDDTPTPGESLPRPTELRARLYAFALGAKDVASAPSKPRAIKEAIAKKIETFATNPRYAPRQPGLLPELLRAVKDDETMRRELAAIIARDPALVSTLLKLANSAFYRTSDQPVESIERAVAVLGTEGIRSLVAAALMQPVLRKAGKPAEFVEIIWEQTYRGAAAAEAHAAFVEKTDRFAAQLLGLLMGLGTIIAYRASIEQFSSRKLEPDPAVIVAVVSAHAAPAARYVARHWGLSDRILDALEEAASSRADSAVSPLGRSLRFGLSLGTLAVLRERGLVGEDDADAAVDALGAPRKVAQLIWQRIRA